MCGRIHSRFPLFPRHAPVGRGGAPFSRPPPPFRKIASAQLTASRGKGRARRWRRPAARAAFSLEARGSHFRTEFSLCRRAARRGRLIVGRFREFDSISDGFSFAVVKTVRFWV